MNEVQSTIRIRGVEPLGDYRLRVHWANGKVMNVDLGQLVLRLKGLRPLRDPATFAMAFAGEGGFSVLWPKDLDVGADRLYELALEQNGHGDAAEFNRWRWRNGLSLSGAAEALDIGRRTVAYYASGEQPVPRTVLLACKGWEAEHGGQKSERRAAVA